MNTEELVMGVLEESGMSLTSDEVAAKTGIHEATAAKCLAALASKDLVEKRVVAGTELYTPKGRKRGIF